MGIIQPMTYNISLNFSAANFAVDEAEASDQFSGTTLITFKVLNNSRQILLHSVDLEYREVLLKQSGMEAVCLCGTGCRSPNCTDIVIPVR